MDSQSPPPGTLPAALTSQAARALAARLDATLFPHQIEGVAFLLERRRALLADDMGLGKTRQAIVALRHAAPRGPWLVLCPASVRHVWAREIRTVDAAAEVRVIDGTAALPEAGQAAWVIVNYERVARLRAELAGMAFGGFVLDEAHYLRNAFSQRSRATRALLHTAGTAVPVYLLTGTPLMARPRDLFPLLQIIGHPLGQRFLPFAQRYCDARHNGFGWVTDGASNLAELTLQLHGTLLRREKSAVLELPPKIRTWVEVDLRSGAALRGSRHALQLMLTRRWQRAGQAATADRARMSRARVLRHLTTLRRQLALAKLGATRRLVEAALDEGARVIVYSCFDAPVQGLTQHFGAQCLRLTGATPGVERARIVDRFQHDAGVRVLCANLLAGGVGLTLTAASHVVFNDLDWVPGNHWQAEDRACRIGQRGTVNVHYLVARGTVDEFVAALLETRTALFSAVVEGRALAADADGDLLTALEAALAAIAPGRIDAGEPTLADTELDALLQAATRHVRETARGRLDAGRERAGAGCSRDVDSNGDRAT